jgi:hypothetical protein
MRLNTLWIPIIVLSLAGCGEDGIELEKGPSLKVDRPMVGFGLEFNSGTIIETTGFSSLALENGGDEPLVITKITRTGPSVFSVRLPPEFTSTQPLQLESRERTFVELQFKPTDKLKYDGALIIESNDPKTPQREIKLVGCGLLNPQDTLLKECVDLFK